MQNRATTQVWLPKNQATPTQTIQPKENDTKLCIKATWQEKGKWVLKENQLAPRPPHYKEHKEGNMTIKERAILLKFQLFKILPTKIATLK